MNTLFNTRKSQIWVETVIYTAIGLTIIGILLYISIPIVNRYKDETVVEQTVNLMNDLDLKISDVKIAGFGNKRTVPELAIKKGNLEIDYTNDKITYILENTLLKYSELDEDVPYGPMIIRTQRNQLNDDRYDVRLILNYADIDLVGNGGEERKIFTKSPSPYALSIENQGTEGDKIKIKIGES